MSAVTELCRKSLAFWAGPGRWVITYSYRSLGPPSFPSVFNYKVQILPKYKGGAQHLAGMIFKTVQGFSSILKGNNFFVLAIS